MGNVGSVVRTQRRKKQQAVAYLGGKCVACGYCRCQAALEFHHPDPALKEFTLNYIVSRWLGSGCARSWTSVSFCAATAIGRATSGCKKPMIPGSFSKTSSS